MLGLECGGKHWYVKLTHNYSRSVYFGRSYAGPNIAKIEH